MTFNRKISQIPTQVSTLTGGEKFEAVQSGATKYATATDIATFAASNLTTLPNDLITNAMVNASAGIVDTKLATISTAGKVANSATTATASNTSSAIVARDANGDTAARDASLRQLVLRGDTSGTATIKVPAVAGTPTFTLPATTGSAGEVLSTDGAGILSWIAAGGGGGGAKYAVVSMSANQTPSAFSWVKVTINTEDYDPDALLSISSNVIALTAGTYIISGICGVGMYLPPGGYAGGAFRLRNTSDSTNAVVSPEWYAYADSANTDTYYDSRDVSFSCVVTIASTKNYELQAYLNQSGGDSIITGDRSLGLGGMKARLTFIQVA